jgi:hypothetical protein
MRRLFIATVCLTLGWLAIDVPLDRANAHDEKVIRIRMTSGELRAQGLAVGPEAQPLPNSCQSFGYGQVIKGLSVSDELLAHFKARGFTLESVCLAFVSVMRYDLESGQQLPLAFVPKSDGDSYEIPLNVPLCFRNGVPYLECDEKFSWWFGTKYSPQEVAENRQNEQEMDARVRAFIQQNRLSGVFFRMDRDSGKDGFPEIISPSVEYEFFLASRALPRGYGYALHGPEGDDPGTEDVNRSTYQKKAGVSSLWSD